MENHCLSPLSSNSKPLSLSLFTEFSLSLSCHFISSSWLSKMGNVSSTCSAVSSSVNYTGGDLGSGKGDIYNRLREEGALKYKKLCESQELTLEKVYYCQRDLGGNGGKGAINHDYLVLEFLNEGEKVIRIMAEKLGGPAPGIHILFCGASSLKHCTSEANLRGKRVGLQKVEAVLEDPAYVDYHLFFSNCWHYAKDKAVHLIKLCQNLPDTTGEERSRLDEERLNAGLFLQDHTL